MKKLSVIIPVYNTDKYLKKCLESVINQTYKNLEIILINDGSTDTSEKICNEYLQKDNRIKMINKKNEGLSIARNIGIDISTGEYLTFIDSDDWIELNMFEEMMKGSDDVDLIICGISYVDKDNIKINEYIPLDKSFSEICIHSFACNKIFSKKLFNEIRFPSNKIFEDFFIIPKIYINCKNIKIISESFYNYYQRSNSLSHKRDNLKMFDLLEAYKEIEDYLIINNLNEFFYEFLILKKKCKKYFLYQYFSLQSFVFKITQYKILRDSLAKLNLWNFLDNFKYILIVIYPRIYIKKFYYWLKGGRK